MNIRIGAAQVPDIRNDIEAALDLIVQFGLKAESLNVVLLLFPECFLQGYFTNDDAKALAIDLSSPDFSSLLNRLADVVPTLVFGLIERDGSQIYNTAVIVERGKLVGKYRKINLLPGEQVFSKGIDYPTFSVDGIVFGINICYDTQFPEGADSLRSQGAKVILCPANNMMRIDSAETWKDRHHELRLERVRETGLWLISSDVTGERDGRISYGPTSVISPNAEIADQVPLQATGMVYATIPS